MSPYDIAMSSASRCGFCVDVRQTLGALASIKNALLDIKGKALSGLPTHDGSRKGARVR